jgi:transposase
MKGNRYPAEFKAEAVRQVIEQGRGVVEVSQRLGMSDKSLYEWVKQARARDSSPASGEVATLRSEVTRLKAELRRTTEERDILKKAAAYFAKVSA